MGLLFLRIITKLFLETRTLSEESGLLLRAFQMGSGLALILDWFHSGT